MTTRARARRTLAAGLIVLLSLAAVGSVWPADAQTRKTTTTTTTETSIPVAPGETAPNGGPLLVAGDVASDAPDDTTTSDDSTGTVVALVISGLLVVALLLALLTYWFWRNTRPTKLGDTKPEETEPEPAAAEG